MSMSIDMYSALLGSGSTTATQYSSMLNSGSSLSSIAASSELQNSIENAQTDEELMEACKSFEQYMLEQVFKSMQETVNSDEEEESEYTSMFNDMMIEEYAKTAVDAQGYGIAQMLYESMKRSE